MQYHASIQHEIANGWVVARERTEIFLPVRVRQEAHVHHDVGIDRQAVLVAEALHRDLEAMVVTGLVEGSQQLRLQLVDVQFRGIDDQIGRGAHRFDLTALELNGLDQTIGLTIEGMLAPSRVVTLHERGVGGVEEQQANPVAGGAQRCHLRQQLRGLAPGDEREAFDVAPRLADELDDRVHQRGREVVDDVPAEVLEDRGGSGTSCPGHSGDQKDVGHRRELYASRPFGSGHSGAVTVFGCAGRADVGWWPPPRIRRRGR